MAHPTAARRLARFVVGLALEDVPAPVATKATLLALDTLGNGLAACREDFGRAVLEVAERLGGPPESALIGATTKVAAANAVLASVFGNSGRATLRALPMGVFGVNRII